MESKKYWAKRTAKAQARLTERGIKKTEAQLIKYYQNTMDTVIAAFEDTYYKILLTMDNGKEPTPADLYKLDKYWKMQGEVRAELLKFGNKQVRFLSDAFMEQYVGVWEAMALPSQPEYTKLDKKTLQQVINQIWCADGKSWSQRIWGNTEQLLESLNEGLIHVIASGKPVGDLKKHLMKSFGVSFSKADALVRTELAHIQTQAARDRYQNYGIGQVEILADEDERRCDVCGDLHGKRYSVNDTIPIPAHPRCRCCILPVVED